MLTNKDIDELIVRAELSAEENIQSALQEYYRPDVEQETAMLWAELEEPIKKLVKMRAPEAVRRIEELIRK